MNPAKFDTLIAETAVLGGAVLGCGGGGRLEVGLQLGQQIAEHNQPPLAALSGLPPQSKLAAVATFHTSSVDTTYTASFRSYHALGLLKKHCSAEIGGLFNAGYGAVDTIIGWEAAGPANLPLVDVGPRSDLHPDPAINLLKAMPDEQHTFTMAVVSAKTDADQLIEQAHHGSAHHLIDTLNQIASRFSGSFTVVLGPVSYGWLAAQGRQGFISAALNTGAAILDADEHGSLAATAAVCQNLDGRRLIFGTVTGIKYRLQGREKQALFTLRDENNRLVILTQWHRYMNLTIEKEQVAAFPDKIVTLGSTGTPLAGEEISQGHEIFIIAA